MKELDRIIDIYNRYGVKAQERFSQNFLIDDKKLDVISSSLDLDKTDEIIEIGPGLGSLTKRLVNIGKKVTAVELDKDMIKVLLNEFKGVDNFNLIEGNFLNIDLNMFHVKQKSFIGNLPYSITTKLIKKVFEADYFVNFNFMVQKDIVDKLMYKENKSTNTDLGVFLALKGKLEVVTDLSPSSFYPSPKVNSSFLKFTLENELYDKYTLELLETLFKNPRKNINNNIKNSSLKMVDKDLERLHISPLKRPHELTLEEFKKIIALNDLYNLGEE